MSTMSIRSPVQVDGTVTADQATKAGEAVVLGSDGKIPSSMYDKGTYTLPVATASRLGGVKVGTGLSVATDGTVKVTIEEYILPVATASALGGVKVGSGLSVTGDGTVSAVVPEYTLEPGAGHTTIRLMKDGEIKSNIIHPVTSADLQADGENGIQLQVAGANAQNSSVDAVRSVSNAIANGKLTTTVNGVSSAAIDLPASGGSGITLEKFTTIPELLALLSAHKAAREVISVSFSAYITDTGNIYGFQSYPCIHGINSGSYILYGSGLYYSSTKKNYLITDISIPTTSTGSYIMHYQSAVGTSTSTTISYPIEQGYVLVYGKAPDDGGMILIRPHPSLSTPSSI